MKKLFIRIFVLALLFFVLGFSFAACNNPQTFVVTYSADVGGTIEGKSEQLVEKSNDGAAVVAIPNTGYKFVEWSDGLETAERIDTNITESLSLTAYFEKIKLTVTYLADNNGTISGEKTQSIPYDESGTKVTAIPNTGYEFKEWSDGLKTTERTDTNITQSLTLTAYFEKIKLTVTYSADVGGTISGEKTQFVPYDESGTKVTAVPNTGYKFVEWSDGLKTAERTDTNITQSLTLTAYFEKIKLTVTYSADVGGTISGEKTQFVPYDESGTKVTAVPNTGYEFKEWSDGLKTAGRTDVNITQSLTLTAYFEKIKLTVTYLAAEGGTISGEKTQSVPYDESGTKVTAVPNTGYEFKEWSDGLKTTERIDTNITQSLTLTAYFEKIKLTVTYSADVGGTIGGEKTQSVPYDENGTKVTAVPDTGYKFVEWSDGLKTTERTDTNITKSLSFTAYFERMQLTVTYKAGANGTVSGILSQTMYYGENAIRVTAIPNTGYEFVEWSDGLKTAGRADTSITQSLTLTAYFEKIKLTVTYSADVGGTIGGEKTQSVPYDESSTKVTAVPNAGYRFVEWSDGLKTAERTDTNITQSLTVSAYFVRTVKQFTYNYNNFDENNEIKSVVIDYYNLNQISLVVPKKEYFNFKGWYLDKDYTIKVSDELGNLVIGHELFDGDDVNLYAKWQVIEETTFKILMIFVTEVKATLFTYEGVEVKVDYKMSPMERQICQLVPIMLKKTLDEMMEGLVTFEIDTYFTTTPLNENNFSIGTSWGNVGWFRTHMIMGDKIPEVSHLLKNYRTTITTFGMNDYNDVLDNGGGGGQRKQASIHIESLFKQSLINNIPIEVLLDTSYRDWKAIMELYTHEFAHTCETMLNYEEIWEYHNALGYYGNELTRLEITKRYLLNILDKENHLPCIPYAFWQNKPKTLTYVYNGATGNNTDKTIQFSYDNFYPSRFTVPTREGYTFKGWYLDPDFTVIVALSNGYPHVIMHIFFADDTQYIYAKWARE